jgi:hypothetical protein
VAQWGKESETMEKHVSLVMAFHFGLGIAGILAACIVFVAVTGGGILSGDEEAIAITGGVGSAVALLVFFLSLPPIIAGFALLKREPWVRFVVLIVAVLDLMSVPFGTILGIYTIWVLSQDEAAELFARGSKP